MKNRLHYQKDSPLCGTLVIIACSFVLFKMWNSFYSFMNTIISIVSILGIIIGIGLIFMKEKPLGEKNGKNNI